MRILNSRSVGSCRTDSAPLEPLEHLEGAVEPQLRARARTAPPATRARTDAATAGPDAARPSSGTARTVATSAT
jgi:hypothetical protein